MIKGLFPSRCAETPAISRLQTWKTGHGHGRGEIITLTLGEFKKLVSYLDADTVDTVVFDRDLTASVPGKTGHWFDTADFQRSTENIFIFEHRMYPLI
jgi:hypothetical protein